jgi:hypothetical protein
MSKDPSVPYFELDYARALSRRLRDPKPSVAERSVERPSYLRFQAPRSAGSAPSFDAAALGQSLREVRNAWGATAWHTLLDGCTAAAGASGAFVMDSQGLVIATRGQLDHETAERLGGRLMLTLDQAAKMGDQARVVCVEVDAHWLTGLRGPNPNQQDVTLGILGEEPVGREARRVIADLLASIGG